MFNGEATCRGAEKFFRLLINPLRVCAGEFYFYTEFGSKEVYYNECSFG